MIMLNLVPIVGMLGAGEYDSAGASFGGFFAQALAVLALLIIPVGAMFYGLYYLVSLPMRRQERARLFLNLLEVGMNEGRSPEQTIVAVAGSGDRAIGVRFHLLAAHIESGLSLVQALKKVPHMLPIQIVGMIQAGIEAGDLRKVLPACRQILKDASGKVWNAQNYIALIAFGVGPLWILIFHVLLVFVFPKFKQIMLDMGVEMEGLLPWLLEHATWLELFQFLTLACLYLGLMFYAGGPRFSRWIEGLLPGLHGLAIRLLPWKMKRLHRDFSAILAILLDAGVTEDRALMLAAESSGMNSFRKRIAAITADLRGGIRLTDAVKRLDDSGEFQWRLANVTSAKGSFVTALQGWQETLEAQAFQQEQVITQLFTTGLVFVNGIMVGAVVVGVFQALIAVINGAALW